MAPDLSRIPAFFHNYINQVAPAENLNQVLQRHAADWPQFLRQIPADRWEYAYDEGKWTIKEVVQHVIDAERIFSYRALCLARKDKTALPSFDENAYAANSRANNRSATDLIEETELVCRSTIKLFASFDEEQLNASGTVSGNSIYTAALAYITAGHALHHQRLIASRYLNEKAAAE